jgi:hypothetical protein
MQTLPIVPGLDGIFLRLNPATSIRRVQFNPGLNRRHGPVAMLECRVIPSFTADWSVL